MPSLESTLEAALFGNSISIMLYGITTLQAYTYAQDYFEDPVLLRLLVLAIWIIETIHSALCLHGMHCMFVKNFGVITSPDKLYWSQGAMILSGIIIMFAVHCYFARRVWMIGNSPQTLTTVIVVVAVVHLAFGIATYALTLHFDTWAAMRSRIISQAMICGGLGSACIADLLIAASLVYYLRQRRQALQQYHSALSSLTVYIVSTGLSTAVLSVSTLLTFMFVPHGGVFLGLASIQSKAYANAFLTNLNARQTIRNRMMRSGASGGADDGDDYVSAEFTSVLLSGIKSTTRHRASNVSATASGAMSPSTDVVVMAR